MDETILKWYGLKDVARRVFNVSKYERHQVDVYVQFLKVNK